ncbi:hypothetical protein ABC977_16045 [Thioalkalicoccus limnaeus]|uniref:Uncharacterized protein n=1 Tax=Thioalkalicoccus limnaeus TaxID=120681 RepID=A0ABV4BHB6_9GAMM
MRTLPLREGGQESCAIRYVCFRQSPKLIECSPKGQNAMVENVDSLILEHLRAIPADVATVREDVREIKQRLTSLETGVAGLRRDHAGLYRDMAD